MDRLRRTLPKAAAVVPAEAAEIAETESVSDLSDGRLFVGLMKHKPSMPQPHQSHKIHGRISAAFSERPVQAASAGAGDGRNILDADGLVPVRLDVFLRPSNLPGRSARRLGFQKMTVVVPVAAQERDHQSLLDL